jgi:hypothetical protein
MLELIPYFEGKKKILENKVTKFQTWKMENTKLKTPNLFFYYYYYYFGGKIHGSRVR